MKNNQPVLFILQYEYKTTASRKRRLRSHASAYKRACYF